MRGSGQFTDEDRVKKGANLTTMTITANSFDSEEFAGGLNEAKLIGDFDGANAAAPQIKQVDGSTLEEVGDST